MSRMQLCLIGSVICIGIMGYFSNFGKLDILDSHFQLWDRHSGPEILRDMGIAGRERYLKLNAVDFVFPLFYATLLADLLKSRGYILGAYISIGAGLFDLMEKFLHSNPIKKPSNFHRSALTTAYFSLV